MFCTKISYSVSKNAGKKDVDFRRTGTLTRRLGCLVSFNLIIHAIYRPGITISKREK